MTPNVARPALTAVRGEDRTYACTHQNSGSDSTPVNISGWTITVTAKVKPEGTAVLTKTGTVVSGSAGTYSWSVTHADTLINPQEYQLDIWRVDSGARTLMALGTWTVLSEVLY
jgi:hypothetical protein